MRPIDRGEKPNIKAYTYRAYYESLSERIGNYCSYCERPLPDSELNVEHIRPKSSNKEYELCWDNLLLSCFTCNSRKDHSDAAIKDVNDLNFDDYAFPHIYDTYHLIDYPSPTYMPEFNQKADGKYKSKVENLLRLIQLDNADNLTEEQILEENEISKYRIYAGQDATEMKRDLGNNPNDEQLENAKKKIKREIEKTGFWSIWMKAFEDVEPIRDFLLELLPGTEIRYFDIQEEHSLCEREHKYKDLIAILAHRAEYKKKKGKITNEDQWINEIWAVINNRIPDLSKEEKNFIQIYLEELKK